MTTEYFRVRNGLSVGEDKFTVDAATGNVVVEGNLTVNGDTTTLNTSELQVEDNKITLNKNVTASPSLDAGIIVERGSSTDAALNWNESTDKWEQNRGGVVTVIPVNTTELDEGSNLYYTTTRFDDRLATKSTTNLAEGTNLYYTTTRFDDRLATKSTTNLAEGTNLYYTDTRADARVSAGIGAIDYPVDSVNTQTGAVVLDTDDISEGTNKYFSNTLARGAVSAGTGVGYDSATGVVSIGQSVATSADVRFDSVATTRTVTGGGKQVDANGDVLVFNNTINTTQQPVSAVFDNTTTNRRGSIVVREYGQNTGSNATSSTIGNAIITLEGSRGTGTAPTNVNATNSNVGTISAGYYDGTRFTSESGLGQPVLLTFQATEATASETSVFTGSISGTTMTVTAVASGAVHVGQLITGTGIAVGTTITAYGTNTFGGTGTYTVSFSQTTASTTITGVGTTAGGGRSIFVQAVTGNKISAASRQTVWVTGQAAPSTQTTNGVTIPKNAALNILQGNLDGGDITLVNSAGNIVYKGRGTQNLSLNQMTVLMTGVTSSDECQFSGYIDDGAGSTGNTLTATSVTSGVLYIGQRIFAVGLNNATPYFITALGTGTGTTGTYTVASTFQTAGVLLGSSGSPVNMVGTPDDYGMINSGTAINALVSRKSTVSGRRAPLKLNDEMFAFRTQGQTGAIGTTTASNSSQIRFLAAEDFTTSVSGTQFEILTNNLGTNTTDIRMSTNSNTTVFKSNSYNFKNSSGTDLATINSSGHVTATKFIGDGSSLTGVAAANQSLNTSNNVVFNQVSVAGINISNTNRITISASGRGVLDVGDVNIAQMGSTFQSVYAPGFKYNGLMSSSTQQSGSYFEISSRWKTASTDTDYTTPLGGWGLGQFGFSANTGVDDASQQSAGGIVIKATENWDATHYGSKFVMSSNILGNGGSRQILSLSPETAVFSSLTQVFQNNAAGGVAYLTLNSASATFTQPVQLPSYTAAGKPASGNVGQMIAITNSAGGGNPNGMIAFWDTTNARWSYIHDNSAV